MESLISVTFFFSVAKWIRAQQAHYLKTESSKQLTNTNWFLMHLKPLVQDLPLKGKESSKYI